MTKQVVRLILVTLTSLAIFWLPFKLKIPAVWGVKFEDAGMERIVSNFDGINFLIVAKTAYNPEKIEVEYADILSGRKALYFSAHYPVYALLVAIFDTFMSGPNAILATIVISNILLTIALYWFFQWYFQDEKLAAWGATIALFFPARMLAVRGVGSNELLFIFFVIASLLLHNKRNRWGAAIMGSLAVLTRSPGIILFLAYLFQYALLDLRLSKKIQLFLPYLLIPTSLLGLWIFYGYQFGSFWAYFQVGGNINLYWPFAVFGSSMPWVGEIWQEDIIYLIAFMSIGIYFFIKRRGMSGMSLFALLYGIFTICVAHRDLARYSLPIMPFVIAGWSEIVSTKFSKLIAVILIVPIFLYAWQFVLANYQPITDWSRFL